MQNDLNIKSFETWLKNHHLLNETTNQLQKVFFFKLGESKIDIKNFYFFFSFFPFFVREDLIFSGTKVERFLVSYSLKGHDHDM